MVHFLEDDDRTLLKHFNTLEDFEKLEGRIQQLLNTAVQKRDKVQAQEKGNTQNTSKKDDPSSDDDDIGLDLFG
jgi:hypothetical protein